MKMVKSEFIAKLEGNELSMFRNTESQIVWETFDKKAKKCTIGDFFFLIKELDDEARRSNI